MRLEQAYRILDIPEAATEAEVRAAHRDLIKVWHPDRFAHDPVMQQKAQEKLKLINEAFDTIVAGGNRWEGTRPEPVPQERKASQVWPRMWVIFGCVFLALFMLLRRPTFGGLLIAGILLVVAFALTLRKR